jgi:hypothetical protein
VVFLFDGMGKYNLSIHQGASKFIRSHALTDIYSVNPATTVACTTAFLSAKFPIENGYLSWSIYFKELGKAIDVFPNRESWSGEKIEGKNLIEEACPYKNIATLLQEKGVKAEAMFQFPVNGTSGPRNYRQLMKKASAFFDNGGEFLYCYMTNPDHYEHQYGVKSLHVDFVIRRINAFLKKFSKKNPDVLAFSFADHGLIDVKYVDLAAYQDIEKCLSIPFSLEGRTPTFFVKEGMADEFEKAFDKHFGESFALLKRDEFLKKGYFGEGEALQHSLDSLGDYIAVSLDETIIYDSSAYKNKHMLKGHHAGGTMEEREISLSAYNI